MVDHDGVIHYSPNVPAFLKAPVRERLEAAVGLPTIVDNDANAAVVAELTHGAAYGEREVLLITLGTGLGGGIVTRGRVLRGAHGFGAEIGHFQVDPDGPALRVRAAGSLGGHRVGECARCHGPRVGGRGAGARRAPAGRRRRGRGHRSPRGGGRARGRSGGDRAHRRVRRVRGRRPRGVGEHPRPRRSSSSPAASSTWPTCSSTRCAPRSGAGSRARRTVPRSRSWPPRSGVTPASSVPRCWRGSSRDGQGGDHVAVVPRRRRYGTGGGGRGRSLGARRRVRLRPPVPARPRRSAPPRARDVRVDGCGRVGDGADRGGLPRGPRDAAAVRDAGQRLRHAGAHPRSRTPPRRDRRR